MSSTRRKLGSMSIASRRILVRSAGAAVVCLGSVVCSAQPPAPAGSAGTFQKVCGVCHTPQSVLGTRRTRAQWQEIIDKMAGLGAKATDEEFASILNYLSAQYGPDSANEAA